MISPPPALKWVACLGLALLLTLWCFSQTSGFGLTWTDDAELIVNPQTQPGMAGAWLAISKGFFISPGTYWRPVPLLSFQISNLFPPAERLEAAHVLSVAMGMFYVLLLFWVGWLIRGRAVARARLLAALCLYFALYPPLVESVAWIAGRFDLLLCLCSLLVFASALSDHRRPSPVKLLAIAALCAAGLLCKETASLAIAGALTSAHAMAGVSGENGGRASARWKVHAALWLVLSGLWALAYLCVSDISGIERTLSPRRSPGEQVELGFWLYACYWKILLLPVLFTSAVHAVPASMGLGAATGVLALAVSGVLVGWLAHSHRWRELLLVLAVSVPLLFLALLGSTARFDLEIVAADRYLLPFLPAVLCLAFIAIQRLGGLLQSLNHTATDQSIINLLAAGVVCMALVEAAHNRIEARSWRNQAAFWGSAWIRNQDSSMAAVSWSSELLAMGQPSKALDVLRKRLADLRSADSSYLDPRLTWNRVAIVTYAQQLDGAGRADLAIAELNYWIHERSVRTSMLYGALAISLADSGECASAWSASRSATWKDEMQSFFIDLDEERGKLASALSRCPLH